MDTSRKPGLFAGIVVVAALRLGEPSMVVAGTQLKAVGEQRHLLGHGIGGAGVVGQAPGPTQQARDAIVELLQDAGDSSSVGAGKGWKTGAAPEAWRPDRSLRDDRCP
jgi:hypothetical protein